VLHKNSTETVRMLLEERLGVGQRDEQGRISPVELFVGEENGLRDRNDWTT
ncbi:Serine/threonine protein kinase, partial [Giardia duodenalis]